jgi:putative transposase
VQPVPSTKACVPRTDYRQVHDDLIEWQFTAPSLNQLWLTNITDTPTREDKLHLCAIKDACSGRIVGYSLDARMTADLAVTALRNAVALPLSAGRGRLTSQAGRGR